MPCSACVTVRYPEFSRTTTSTSTSLQLRSLGLSGIGRPQSVLGGKLLICGSKIRQNLPNANYSDLPLLWQLAVKDAQRRNGINGGDPRSGEEAVYAGFAYP
jgi:hypothetical protein